jgi:hypothetical protein
VSLHPLCLSRSVSRSRFCPHPLTTTWCASSPPLGLSTLCVSERDLPGPPHHYLVRLSTLCVSRPSVSFALYSPHIMGWFSLCRPPPSASLHPLCLSPLHHPTLSSCSPCVSLHPLRLSTLFAFHLYAIPPSLPVPPVCLSTLCISRPSRSVHPLCVPPSTSPHPPGLARPWTARHWDVSVLSHLRSPLN